MWIVLLAAVLPILVGVVAFRMGFGSPDRDDSPPFIGL
jgi:hypothetical protein